MNTDDWTKDQNHNPFEDFKAIEKIDSGPFGKIVVHPHVLNYILNMSLEERLKDIELLLENYIKNAEKKDIINRRKNKRSYKRRWKDLQKAIRILRRVRRRLQKGKKKIRTNKKE